MLHVALQAVRDCNTLLTPFLPHAAQQVHELLGGTGVWSGLPEVREVSEDGNADYPVITGRLRRRGRTVGGDPDRGRARRSRRRR